MGAPSSSGVGFALATVVLRALPLARVALGMTVLPLLPRAIRVSHPEESSREPPLHGPTHCGAVTPAVSVASACAGIRVVKPSQDRIHVRNATGPRQGCNPGLRIAGVEERSAAELALRLFLHALEPGVVVAELVQVRQCDFGRHDLAVVADVRREIAEAVLELDVHPPAELVDVEWRGFPVDPDPSTDAPCF